MPSPKLIEHWETLSIFFHCSQQEDFFFFFFFDGQLLDPSYLAGCQGAKQLQESVGGSPTLPFLDYLAGIDWLLITGLLCSQDEDYLY